MIPVSMDCAQSSIIEANWTMSDTYEIIMGDERFYRFIGDNSMYAFNRLVHPDDRELFELFMEDDNNRLPIMARVLNHINKYRWCLIEKIKEKRVAGDRILQELRMVDVLVENNKLELYMTNVEKYRTLLTLIKEKIFEYNIETGVFTMYIYIDGYSEILERDTLDNWQKKTVQFGYVEDAYVSEFNRLCDSIRGGSSSFSAIFPATILTKGGRKDTLFFKGETISFGTNKSYVVGLISEVGEKTGRQKVQFDNNANKDSATGLLNKKAVTDDIIAAIDNANKVGDRTKKYLIVYDIDNFKSVNDTYGHYFGDEVILSFATEISRVIDGRGINGRIGGDEFMSLITECEDIDEVKVMLKTIRKNLQLKLSEVKHDYMFSCSIGIAEFGKDGNSYEELFKIADTALYIAKEKGRDRYIIYDEKLHGNILKGDEPGFGVKKTAEFMKPMDKCELAANLAECIYQKGKEGIKEVLAEIIDKMNVHGIAVYTKDGDDMRCEYTVGHYSKEPQDASYILSDKFLAMFNEYNMRVMNNVAIMSVEFPEIFKIYKQLNICSSLQVLVKNKDGIVKMFSFDTFGENRRKWSQEDIQAVYLVMRAISAVYK